MGENFNLANSIASIGNILSDYELPAMRDYKHADWMYERLVKTINDFEKDLPDDMQAGGRLVSFAQTIQFSIQDIGYWNPDMIIFYGTLPSGEPVKLVQHTSQLNLLLVAVKRDNPKEPRRKIGFHSKEQSPSEADEL